LVNKPRGWVKVSPYSVSVPHRGGSRWFTRNRGLAFVKIKAPVTPRVPVGFMECSVHRRVPTVGRAVLISQAPCPARVHGGCVGFMIHRGLAVGVVNIVRGFVAHHRGFLHSTSVPRSSYASYPSYSPRGTPGGLV